MERVISLLSDIEHEADIVLSKAKSEKLELNQKYEQDIIALDKKLNDDTEIKLKKLQQQYSKELEQEKSVLSNNCIKQIDELENKYINKKNTIVDNIFNRIIST